MSHMYIIFNKLYKWIKMYPEIIIDSQGVAKQKVQRSHEPFTQFPSMVAFYIIVIQY